MDGSTSKPLRRVKPKRQNDGFIGIFALQATSVIVDGDYTERITLNPCVMGGKPCIRGMRVTVGLVVGLEADDIPAALSYAAWLAEASKMPLVAA